MAGSGKTCSTPNDNAERYMRTHQLACLMALALPLAAQTEASPDAPALKTEKLWQIKTSGIGG